MATVLIVDDEPLMVLDLTRALEEQGHTVLAAKNALESMELMRYAPAVAIVDLVLPDYDGLEVIRSIKQVNSGTRTIAITGVEYDGFDPLDAARKIGADATLKKPIMPEQLLSLLDAVMRG